MKKNSKMFTLVMQICSGNINLRYKQEITRKTSNLSIFKSISVMRNIIAFIMENEIFATQVELFPFFSSHSKLN